MKEWLSDNLRYIIVALIVILAIGAVILGLELYQNSNRDQSSQSGQNSSEDIVIYTEADGTEKTVTEADSAAKETESETVPASEKKETLSSKETETAAGVNAAASAAGSTAAAVQTGETSAAGTTTTESGTAGTGQSGSTVQNNTAVQSGTAAETQPATEPQTQAPETEPPTEAYEPVYMTMTGTCYFRSYADYGDNIIGEYPAGTVVEFLEDVGGWYKVQVDGMVGYMGARFFS